MPWSELATRRRDDPYAASRAYARAGRPRMMQPPTVAIAVCTRDRQTELLRAVASVLRDAVTLPVEQRDHTELLVVDDGQLPRDVVAELRRTAEQAGLSFSYRNKHERPGLLRSRIETISLTRADVVLFVDDDIEMMPGYLARLVRHYVRDPGLAGVGGIDVLGQSEKWTRTIPAVLTGAAAVRLGRFSCAGYNGDSPRWPRARRPFASEYLVGFNMSFRRAALLGLAERDWLSGYGLGEDLYVSVHARRYGPLIVDPALKVAHHLAPSTFGGRDNVRRYHAAKAAHYAHLLVEMNAAGWRFSTWRAAAVALLLHHTATWLVARPRSLREFRRHRMLGCWNGVREGWAVRPGPKSPALSEPAR